MSAVQNRTPTQWADSGRCLARLAGPAFAILLILLLAASAQAGQVVRVGFSPSVGFHEVDVAGRPAGYDVDYLDEISRQTGWAFRFVPVRSRYEALELLKNGHLDLMGGALKTSGRKDGLLYSAYPAGKSHGSLVTLVNRPFVYEDFQSFSTLRIGYAATYVRKDAFLTFAQQQGFVPILREYPDEVALREALHAKAIDAMLVSILDLAQEEKVLARFSYEPFYYVTAPGKPELLEELERAISRISVQSPDFENQLTRRYFPHILHSPLTRAELELIAHLPPLRVGYHALRRPVAYQNEATGEAGGMLPGLLQLIAEKSGLRFELVPLEPPAEGAASPTLADALARGNLDMVLGVGRDAINRVDTAFVLTKTLLASSVSLFGTHGKGLRGQEQQGEVAISADWREGIRHAVATYPGLRVLLCKSTQDCLDMVEQGKADWMLGQQYMVNYLLPKPLYRKIMPLQSSMASEELCLAVAAGAPPGLISILNKSIDAIPEAEKQALVAEHLGELTTPISLADFWSNYRDAAIIILILLFIVVTLVISALHFWRKNQRDAVESERRLSAITNNINGGVMTLAMGAELTILYANNGFWQLLGHDPEAQHSQRMADHLSEEALHTLEGLIRQCVADRSPLELELHLRHQRHGDFPVLFRGAFALDAYEMPLLHAVVMDITPQKRMQDQLAVEKERYRIILEQSNDIVFDIDGEKGEFICSENFAATFGWQWTESFFLKPHSGFGPSHGTPFRTHPDDMSTLVDVRQQVLAGVRMQACLVRIPLAAGGYRWCRIQLSRISRDGMPLRIIGKIVDVDDTVRERQALERQSQRDSLTDLYNKAAFREYVNASLKDRRQAEHPSAILFVDMDNFKTLNDTLGHAIGDKALVAASDELRRVFRNADAIGRFGGDEFCVFVNHIPPQVLLERASAIRKALRMSYSDGAKTVRVTASIGIYLLDGHETSCEDALRHADEALYAAKQKGRDGFVFYDTLVADRQQ